MLGLFTSFEKHKDKIFDYFGYVEDWRIFPIVFYTEYYWAEDGDRVVFSEEKENLIQEDLVGNHYCHSIYKQRHLPKWVYRGKDFTMIVVDTNVDGNKYLQVFSNDLEVKENVLAFDY